MAIRVPVILLNWNGIEDTIECVESLLNQENTEPLIFIGDNASANQEGSQLKSTYASESNIHVYLFDENHGFAKGCNLLMQEAMQLYPDSTALALLNNDAVADPDWLWHLSQTMNNTGAGMVGSMLVSYHDRSILDNVGHQMLSSGEIVPIGNKAPTDQYLSQVTNFGSCAAGVLYSCQMLDQIGLYDIYFHTGYEDAEIGARALVAGYKSIYCPEAVVYHKVSQSVGKIFDENYLKIIQKSIYYTYLKLMPTLLLIWTLPGIIVKMMTMFLLNLLTNQRHRNRIHGAALRSIWNDRKLIREKRREFYDKVTPVSSFNVRRQQINWVYFDIKRFWRFHIKGEKSQLEKVG